MNIDYTTYLAHAKNFRQRFLILHYTAGNFQASIDELIGKSVSAHYRSKYICGPNRQLSQQFNLSL